LPALVFPLLSCSLTDRLLSPALLGFLRRDRSLFSACTRCSTANQLRIWDKPPQPALALHRRTLAGVNAPQTHQLSTPERPLVGGTRLEPQVRSLPGPLKQSLQRRVFSNRRLLLAPSTERE
jgi:hypothetical protein